jgi:hypothetical protein
MLVAYNLIKQYVINLLRVFLNFKLLSIVNNEPYQYMLQWTSENTEGTIKNEQSIETGNIGTQDTGRRQTNNK